MVREIPADVHGVIFLGGLRSVVSAEQATAINREGFHAARMVAAHMDADTVCEAEADAG